jgi:hypothetical protein
VLEHLAGDESALNTIMEEGCVQVLPSWGYACGGSPLRGWLFCSLLLLLLLRMRAAHLVSPHAVLSGGPCTAMSLLCVPPFLFLPRRRW